jgi:hypothetical protein
LLLLELDKKEPFSKDDLKYSMELVQSMGFLPVVIHAVAKRLKTTNEPLSRFAKSYSNEVCTPPLTLFRIFWELDSLIENFVLDLPE